MRPLTALVAAATCLLPALAFPAAESELLELPESAVQRQPGPPGEGSEPGEALFTNAVTYCAEAKAVLVDQFDIAYWNANNSVTFSFSFASIEPNLNVSASLFLNAYGNTIFNETIELCDLVAGVLCPLPMINFTGYGTYPLPDSIQSQIPQLAWTVPNLEAYARVQLLNSATDEVAACLQATLSNGWTTQLSSVKWGTSMFTLAAGLVGMAHAVAVNSISPAIYRWFDVLSLYQAAAAAGLMHLNYPLVFSNFVQNFHWSLGLFYSRTMQRSISAMRRKTGGKMPGDAYNDVQYINRRLSPYNMFGVNMTSVLDNLDDTDKFANFISTLKTDTSGLSRRAQKIPSLIDQQGASNLTTGIPVYTNSMGITQANAYDTVFFFFLAFLAIIMAFSLVVGAIVWILPRGRKNGWRDRLRGSWWNFCAANALRACLVFFFPILIFGFYQWRIGTKDSGLSIFFSVLGVFLVLVPMITVFVLSVVRARRLRSKMDVSPLYSDFHFYHAVGDALYRQYRQKYHFFWFAPMLLSLIAKAGFIGFGQSNAWAQVVGCVVVEFIVLCCQIGLRPHKDRKGDWLGPILTLFRMVMFGMLIAFIESMKVKAIPRTVIGIVEIALVGIPTVLLLWGLIFNSFYGIFWCRKRARVEDGTHLERDDDVLNEKTSSNDDSTLQALDPVGSYDTQGYKTGRNYDESPSASSSIPAQYAYDSAAAGNGVISDSTPYDPHNRNSRISGDNYIDFSRPQRQSYGNYDQPAYGGNRWSQA